MVKKSKWLRGFEKNPKIPFFTAELIIYAKRSTHRDF